jgi:hypothetical protein
MAARGGPDGDAKSFHHIRQRFFENTIIDGRSKIRNPISKCNLPRKCSAKLILYTPFASFFVAEEFPQKRNLLLVAEIISPTCFQASGLLW